MVATITFDVEGRLYKISQDILMKYPDTMLAKACSDTWTSSKTSGEPIFINGNSERFQHVLDFCRTGRIFLPLSVTKEAILHDMEYYGFDRATIEPCVDWESGQGEGPIRLVSLAHAFNKKLMSMQEERASLDSKISAMSVARLCFQSFCQQSNDKGRAHINQSYGNEEFLSEALADLGMTFEKVEGHGNLQYIYYKKASL